MSNGQSVWGFHLWSQTIFCYFLRIYSSLGLDESPKGSLVWGWGPASGQQKRWGETENSPELRTLGKNPECFSYTICKKYFLVHSSTSNRPFSLLVFWHPGPPYLRSNVELITDITKIPRNITWPEWRKDAGIMKFQFPSKHCPLGHKEKASRALDMKWCKIPV